MKIVMRVATVGLLAAAPVLLAQQSGDGVMYWPKGVPPQGKSYKADYGNSIISLSHRDANGKVEVHKTKTDIMVIQSGEADLVTGGEPVGLVSTGPNEFLGTSIKGGTKRHIGPGDVIRVPAGTPHQFFLAPGTQITYSVVKVVEAPKS